MPRYVAFLRAVNVGGRIVEMDALKKIFASTGFADVESFLASGNVVFSSKGVKGLETKIEARLAKALTASLSFEVPVFVRTLEELALIAVHRPFPEQVVAAAPTLLVGFLSKNLDAEGVARLSALESADDAPRDQHDPPDGGAIRVLTSTGSGRLDEMYICDIYFFAWPGFWTRSSDSNGTRETPRRTGSAITCRFPSASRSFSTSRSP